MHEHRAPALGRGLEHRDDPFVVEPEPVHRREEAGASQAVLTEPLPDPGAGVGRHRVQHEGSGQARRVPGGRFRDRRLVTRDARHDGGARHAVTVELRHPSIPRARREDQVDPTRALSADRTAGSRAGGADGSRPSVAKKPAEKKWQCASLRPVACGSVIVVACGAVGCSLSRSYLLQRCYGLDKGSHEVGRGNSSPPAAGRKSVPR